MHGAIISGVTYKKYTGDLWRVLRVVVDNPYYYSPENDVVVSHSSTTNLGQLYCYVKTYTANLKLVGGWGQNYSDALNEIKFSQPIPGGMIGYIYRKGNLPDGFPFYEGGGGVEKYIEGQKAISLTGNDLNGVLNYKKLIWENYVWDQSVSDKHYYYVTPNILQDQNFTDEYGSLNCWRLKDTFNLYTPEWYIRYNDQYKDMIYYEQLPPFTPLPPMVSGKVIGAFQSPVENATITLVSTDGTFSQSAPSDANGYFHIDNLPVNKSYHISIEKTGYQSILDKEIREGNPMLNGYRWYKPYTLQPLAQVHGYVKNEVGNGVDCHISLGGDTPEASQDEQAFQAMFYFKYGHIGFYPTEFTVAVPKDKIHLLIDFDDESYEDLDTVINVTKSYQEIGTIIARLRMRRLELTVNEKVYAQPLSVYSPIQNARVLIPGFSDTLYTNDKGKIFYKFLSSTASDNFQVLVLGPKGKMYEAKQITLSIKNSGSYSSYSVILNPATFIKGYVKVGKSPIAGATVRIDNGSVYPGSSVNYYSQQNLGTLYNQTMLHEWNNNTSHSNYVSMQNHYNLSHVSNYFNNSNANNNVYIPDCSYYAVTASDGSFTLMDVPEEKNLIVKASQLGSQYIGTIDTVYVPKEGVSNLVLQLKVYNEMNITKLYGFPMAVENLKTFNGDVQITGYISKVKSNDQFQINDSNMIFSFTNLSIIKGTLIAGDSIPPAVPKLGFVKTNAVQCDFTAYKTFGGSIRNTGNALKIVEYTKADGKKAGGIAGNVYLNANMFKLANLVVPFDMKLALVKADGSIQNDFNALNADGSAIAQNAKGFKLTMNNSPVKLKIYDFPCKVDDNSSYLNNDSLFFNLNMHTNFTNIKPKDWNVKIGQLKLTPTYMSSFSGTTLDTLKMETWGIASENWALDNTGFHINQGKLNMNGLIVPFTGMKVDTNTVTNATYQLQTMKLLNMVNVNLKPSATGFLSYDNTVKSWEMRIYSNSGICANVTGLPGTGLPDLANTDVINFNIISNYSNGVQTYYAVYDNTPKVRVHDILNFQPGQFFVGQDISGCRVSLILIFPIAKTKLTRKMNSLVSCNIPKQAILFISSINHLHSHSSPKA